MEKRVSKRVHVVFNGWAFNLPRVQWYWYDEKQASLCFEYGNRHSDPALALDVTIHSRRILAIAGWFSDRRALRRKRSMNK